VPALERVPPRRPYADGWSFVSPVVEMPVYLGWLRARVEEAGGSLTRLAMAHLPDGPLVVNCSGLGSRVLAGDPSVTPVRGQVVLVEQVGLEEWWLAEDGPTYVVPRSGDIVLGGTEQAGEWDRRPDPDIATDILRRATALVPALAGARVLRHRVGLRPARPAIRLERVGDVIHCYGHGGAGLTLSWGCADDVVGLT
jgi:D-amino-acid oxidase